MNQPDQERACQYVLDQLGAAERATFEARLRVEPDLAGHVRMLERALEARIAALPQRQPGPAVWGRIEAELAGGAGAGSRAELQPAIGYGQAFDRGLKHRPAVGRDAFRRWALLGGIAAAVLVMLSVALARRVMGLTPAGGVVVATLDQGGSTSRRMPLPEGAEANPGARFVQLAALAEKLWQEPGAGERGNRGYALFDPSSREGFIGVQHAPALRPGQQYRLWVVDARSGEARDAGVLPMREVNRGLYFFSLPEGGDVAGTLSFLVTVESEQSAPAEPTGKVVLGRRF